MAIDKDTIEFVLDESAVVPLPPTKVDITQRGTEDVREYVERHLATVRRENEKYLEWAFMEIAHWKQMCQDLEQELMLAKSEFHIPILSDPPRPKKEREELF